MTLIYSYDGFDELAPLVGVVDNYSSLIWTDRHIGLGNFQLRVPLTMENINVFAEGNFLEIPESEFTMIVESVRMKDKEMVVAGRELTSILDRRLVLATFPTKPPKLTTYLNQLVADSISHFAILPERAIPYFYTLFSEPSGFTKQKDYDQISYGQNLLEAVFDLCKEANLGFKVTRDNPRISFALYHGVDRSKLNRHVTFRFDDDSTSELETIRGAATEKNVAYVRLPPKEGTGVGEVRKIIRNTDLWNQNLTRREMWIDAASIRSDPNFKEANRFNLMSVLGKTELSKNEYTHAVDFEVTPNGQYVYRKDYFIGDIVGVTDMTTNKPIKYQVTEYIHSFEPGKARSYPTFTKWNYSDDQPIP